MLFSLLARRKARVGFRLAPQPRPPEAQGKNPYRWVGGL